MSDIFLSRPTWIDPQHESGLKGFICFLQAHGLNPRTIGTTDFPNESPMDEVIKLMKHCTGAVILGYPQIVAKSGEVKGAPIKEAISLGTEWNHIEAALAYSLHIPLLVIHDTTVSRGIFDRGTLNSFIYSVDLSVPTWSTSDSVTGALNSWIKRLGTNPIDDVKDKNMIPTLQWGCYKFEGIQGLYCPVCYEEKGLKIPASRLQGGHYKCPRCKAELS